MIRYKLVAFLILMIALGMMFFSGTRLFELKQVYQEGDAAYEELSGLVKVTGPASQMLLTTTDDAAMTPKVYIPGLQIDFEALKSINSDAAAWLYILAGQPGEVRRQPLFAGRHGA